MFLHSTCLSDRWRPRLGAEIISKEVVFLLLIDSSASEFYVPTFRNTLPVPFSQVVWRWNSVSKRRLI